MRTPYSKRLAAVLWEEMSRIKWVYTAYWAVLKAEQNVKNAGTDCIQSWLLSSYMLHIYSISQLERLNWHELRGESEALQPDFIQQRCVLWFEK